MFAELLRAPGPVFFGILNVTPDSFSDPGIALHPADAVARARTLLNAGARVLDVGAESTRPGFAPVDAETECSRLLPVLHALRTAFPDAVLSVDTRKAAVARAAIAEGAAIINDVSGLADPAMAPLIRETGVGLIAMRGFAAHLHGEHPASDIPATVLRETLALRDKALMLGIPLRSLCLDPGFGFGLRHLDNLEALAALTPLIAALAPVPLLVGVSRKHFLADAFPDEPDPDRATARFHAACSAAGVRLFRTHAFLPF